jgi:hypothetical protein
MTLPKGLHKGGGNEVSEFVDKHSPQPNRREAWKGLNI